MRHICGFLEVPYMHVSQHKQPLELSGLLAGEGVEGE